MSKEKNVEYCIYVLHILFILIFPGAGENSDVSNRALPNELSAPYEVPHFPIEKIETKKLQ